MPQEGLPEGSKGNPFARAAHGTVTFIRLLKSPNMLICLANGFAAGMPLFYLYHLIPAWLRDSGVDLKTIGLISLVGMPYTYKFLWAPFMDRYTPFFLGRRRGWMLITQIGLLLSLAALALCDPSESVTPIVYLAALTAFLSASQDIVLDAYRRELLPDRELGLGNAMYVNGYRAAVFVPGSLGLILADNMAWPLVHVIIASFMLLAVLKTLIVPETEHGEAPKGLREAVVEPFREFFTRDTGWKHALAILAFLALYKIGDNMATALSTPFYLDIGVSKTEIGTLVKLVGFWSMIAGGLIGGAVIYRIGINKSLYIFGAVQTLSILGFAVLAEAAQLPQFGTAETCDPGFCDTRLWLISGVIAFEYIGVGVGSAGMIAFMARATNTRFTASQLALLTSLVALPRTFANSVTGFLIEGIAPGSEWADYFGTFEGMGYTDFFLFCALCSLPGLALLFVVAPWNGDKEKATDA